MWTVAFGWLTGWAQLWGAETHGSFNLYEPHIPYL